MRRLRASVRVALAVSVLALVLLTAGATAVGYLVEAHNQRAQAAYERCGMREAVYRMFEVDYSLRTIS